MLFCLVLLSRFYEFLGFFFFILFMRCASVSMYLFMFQHVCVCVSVIVCVQVVVCACSSVYFLFVSMHKRNLLNNSLRSSSYIMHVYTLRVQYTRAESIAEHYTCFVSYSQRTAFVCLDRQTTARIKENICITYRPSTKAIDRSIGTGTGYWLLALALAQAKAHTKILQWKSVIS